MTIHTVQIREGDPVRARDHRAIVDQVRRNADAVIGLRQEAGAGQRAASATLYEVTDLPQPGQITAKLAGDSSPTPTEYTVICDPTFSELSREGVTYAYASFIARTATLPDQSTEDQRLTPSLLVGDTFVAMRVSGVLRAIDLGGRQWAAVQP